MRNQHVEQDLDQEPGLGTRYQEWETGVGHQEPKEEPGVGPVQYDKLPELLEQAEVHSSTS